MSKSHVATVSVTRPNDTTQYAAGEVVGAGAASMRFGVDSPQGRITSVILIDSVVAGGIKPECDLLLYSEDITVAADNAAFAPTDAQAATLVAVIPFLAANFKAATANGVIVSALTADIPFQATPNGLLYGVLVARNTYTPTALEVFTVKLGTVS